MYVIHRSTFRAQFTKQDWALTKLTKTHLSSTSLRAMISSMTSLTLSCNQVWHINLRFFLSKIPKMALILRFKKVWKKLAYNFFKNFTEGKVAWLSVQSSNLYNSIRVLQLTKEIRLSLNLILSTKLECLYSLDFNFSPNLKGIA